jgi:hypothetical protein
MEDIIVDIIRDGRVLQVKEIPPAVMAEVAAAVADNAPPREIRYNGGSYFWFVRP